MDGAQGNGFEPIDYIVFLSTLGVSVLIGIYYRFSGGKQNTTEEYLLADRSQHVLPVSFSLMASYMSAITLLGVSAENYMFGFQFIVINLGYLFFTPVAAYLYLPVFYQLQSTSTYQYLEKRFGWAARIATSLSYVTQVTLYMGIVLNAPALVFKSFMEMNEITAILLVGVVCIFYSALGGMKAVILADLFQSLIMFLSLFTIIYLESVRRNGLVEVFKVSQKYGRINLYNFSLDPTERHTWFSLIIGGGFTYLSLYAVNQTQVQRYLTMKNLKTAQMSLWMQWPILTLLSVATSVTGLSIFSRYVGCDPLRAGRIRTSDELMPLFVKDTMNELPGSGGIFVAGILSASLTTVSSCLNSLAAVTVEDYLKPSYKLLMGRNLLPKESLLLTKAVTFLHGLLCIAISIITRSQRGILQVSLSIFGAVGGPVLGIFTLGIFFKFTNQIGAVGGILGGLVVSFILAFGGPKPAPQPLPLSTDSCNGSTYYQFVSMRNETNLKNSEFLYIYRISYLWYIVIGFLVTIIIGIVLSILTKSSNSEDHIVDLNLLSPIVVKQTPSKNEETVPKDSCKERQ